jgi:DNA polymerase III alpha subunit
MTLKKKELTNQFEKNILNNTITFSRYEFNKYYSAAYNVVL